MARPLDRKRPRADEQDLHLSSKKTKLNDLSHRASNFSPEFYDNLSKIHLTSRALRELDRRNDQHSQPEPSSAQRHTTDLAQVIRRGGPLLVRFARGGGPDLLDLRGYQDPNTIMDAMASVASSSTTSKLSKSTKPTTASSKRSSAYDANFEQHLVNHNIFPPLYDFPDDRIPPEPANLDEILGALKVPRGSLSPSVIPKSAFRDFQRKNTTKSEGTVMRSVVPILAGGLNIPNEGHLPFVNLHSLTENTTVNPVPDFFDGAYPGAVDRRIREDLNNIIIPTKHVNVPIVPNFFLEAKGPGGSGDVARAQAALNGAYGARMMCALQNYLAEEIVYDGNAYTFTSTLLDGTLKLYAHHVTAPTSPGQRPEYHTTQVDAYALTGNNKGWLEGTAAFRNLRKLAKNYRDQFIADANQRARNRSADAVATKKDNVASTEEERREASSMFAEPQKDDQERDQDTEESQVTQETNAGLGILYHTQNEDDRNPDHSQPNKEVSTSFATNFTSSVSTEIDQQLQPKPPRSPPSPSSTQLFKKRGPAEG